MNLGTTSGRYILPSDPMPGERPLPYIRSGRHTLIIGLVAVFHVVLIVVPVIYMAVSKWVKPKTPVYVMRLPTVDSLPSEQPSPHPSPLNKKSTGTPEKGKPLSEIPEIPELVKPVEVPQPKPKPQAKPVEKKVETVPESKKTIPVKAKPKQKPKNVVTQPKNRLLSADQIKISHKKVVRKTNRNTSRQSQIDSEARARDARRADAAKALRSLSGEVGGRGTPGGGGGPRGIVSKEVSEYYYKVETFLKRRWNQPSIFGGDRPRVLILFRVAADGRLISARIQERSGNPAMDSSVDEMLRGLSVLPAPPQAMEFTVTMEIDR